MPATPAPATSVLGITAHELHARNVRPPCPLTAVGLERWLLDGGLAVNGDGLLRPTRQVVELARGLDQSMERPLLESRPPPEAGVD